MDVVYLYEQGFKCEHPYMYLTAMIVPKLNKWLEVY